MVEQRTENPWVIGSNPILDIVEFMLTKFISQLRNAHMAYHKSVLFENIGFCVKILNILWDKGLIRGYTFIGGSKIQVFILYNEGFPLLKRLVILSKRTTPLYVSSLELSRLSKLNGVVIVSTIKGIMSADESIKSGYGGEVLAYFE